MVKYFALGLAFLLQSTLKNQASLADFDIVRSGFPGELSSAAGQVEFCQNSSVSDFANSCFFRFYAGLLLC